MIPDRVALLGETLEDQFPGEPPVPGGAPLNVACHLRAFGATPLLVTRLGLDAGGERLMQFLQAHGLSASAVQRDAALPSGRVSVRVEGTRNLFEIPMPQAFDALDAFATRADVVASAPAAFYFGTLAQRDARSRAAIRAALDALHGTRFCDLNLRAPWLSAEVVRASLARADVLKLDAAELAAVADFLEMPTEGDAARALLATYPGLRTLLVTDGERGARCLHRAGRDVIDFRVDAVPPGRVVDTVGAGDGFTAVTILGHLAGWPLAETLARASAFAGALCGVRGAVPQDDAFYAPFRARWGTPS